MIVCHCNRIEHSAIEGCADALARKAPWSLITPVAVYKALGHRPRCGGCMTLAANIIHDRGSLGRDACTSCPLAQFETALADDADAGMVTAAA